MSTPHLDAIWAPLREAISHFREGLDEGPVLPVVSAEEIEKYLYERYDFARPVPPEPLIKDVALMLSRWQVLVGHRHYFGLFNPDTLPITTAADAMAAAFNPQLAAWSHSPAAAEIEAHVLRGFQRLIGYSEEGVSASFASGGAEANHSGVLVALTHHFPSYADEGAAACGGPVAMYASKEAHHSLVKIAHACGIGRAAVREIYPGDDLKLGPESIRQQIHRDRNEGRTPFLVAATAGTTGAGIVDPLPELAALCREEGLWLHVDAAWGGGALLSRKLRSTLAGIELADSITWDAHKWLSVPMGAGMFFCRHRASVQKTFGIQTTYMPAPADSPDPYANTMQWSRRAIGLKVFMALASLGWEGYEELIDHQAAMGDLLREKAVEAGWEIVNPAATLPVVCLTHPEVRAGRTSVSELVRRVYAQRDVWVSEVKLASIGSAIRACITCYRTQPEDIEHLVSALNTALNGA